MCQHNTTIVKYDQGNVQVEVCTWGCGQTIISVKGSDKITESFTAAELSALRERVKAAEALVKEADVLFNQESELCDDPDTEAWIWKWRVRYYFEETDIPPHAMPEDMKA